mmetsp:Transcript_24055/g.58084  ORF Transcript_24055/g.58084 Transcript_24055/m.58084 type:complete len:89 (-) Transcript_24055:52-318(-)
MTNPETKLTHTLHPNQDENATRWINVVIWLLLVASVWFDEYQLHPARMDTNTMARMTCLLTVGAVLDTSDMMRINYSKNDRRMTGRVC